MLDGATGSLGFPGLGQIGCGCRVGVGVGVVEGDFGVEVIVGVGITTGVETTVVHAVKNVISRTAKPLKRKEGVLILRSAFG
jgi:hypothetical protein